MKKLSLALAMTLIGSGCASHLTTFDSNGNPTVGIPVAGSVLVEITSITTYKVAPGTQHAAFSRYCTAEENSEHKFLPLGELHYIGFDPATFAKGEFKLEFYATGNLKTVSLNSNASSGLDSAEGLLDTVLPFVKAPKPSAARVSTVQVAASKKKKLHCLKVGTKIKSISKLKVKS